MERRRHYIYPDMDTLVAAFVCDVNRFLDETSNEEKTACILPFREDQLPWPVFRQLAGQTCPEDWEHVHLYWGDERCVPAEHQESNYGNAKELLLDPLGLSTGQNSPHQGRGGSGAEAERYGRVLLERLPDREWISCI